MSGFNVDYQPIRQVLSQPTVKNLQLTCTLTEDAESKKCWALVTILGDHDLNECGTREDGESFCKSYSRYDLKGTNLCENYLCLLHSS